MEEEDGYYRADDDRDLARLNFDAPSAVDIYVRKLEAFRIAHKAILRRQISLAQRQKKQVLKKTSSGQQKYPDQSCAPHIRAHRYY